MKKISVSEKLICILFIPVLYFLSSRMTTFFYDAWNITVSKFLSAAFIVLAEILIIAFKTPITAYFKNGAGKKKIIFAFSVSAIATVFFSSAFLRGCGDANICICLVGAMLLLGAFLCQLSKNAVYLTHGIKKLKFSKKDILFLVLVFVLLNGEAYLYCSNMRQIFVWDNAGYFTNVHRLNDIFPGAEYFKMVYDSVFETDYNYIIMFPASIMCKLFGKSRLVFILSIINFYLYPLFVLIYTFCKKFFKGTVLKTLCIYLALPYLVFAANTGFIDIGGIIPVFLACILYFHCDRSKTSVLVGLLLAIAVYMRRWYSFFALSFVITILIHGVTEKNLKPFFEVLCSFAFMLLFFAQDFVSSKLLADYRYMYSAYALGLKTDIMLFTRYFGIIMTVLLCLYAILRAKKYKTEAFILLHAVLTFSLFVSIQTHGQQHLALYIPAFIILSASLISRIRKKQGVAILLILSSLQTANTFIPRTQPTSVQEIKKPALIPNFSIYPAVDENAESILEIVEYTDSQIGLNGKTVALLASSLKLNYDTFQNVEVSLSISQKYDINRRSYFLSLSAIDKRDGLSPRLFKADYLLVPSELQLHLAEDEQRVIAVPYQKIIEGVGFGSAYKKEDVYFTLNDGTEIYLYKRTRDITDTEIEQLKEEIFKTE